MLLFYKNGWQKNLRVIKLCYTGQKATGALSPEGDPLFFSAVKLHFRYSVPCMGHDEPCHRPPRGQSFPLAVGYGFSLPEFVEQAALTAVVAPPLFFFQMAGLDQIVDGTFDSAAGEVQLAGDGADGGPAFSVLVGAILEVHIHRLGAVREFLGVDGGEVAQTITSYSSGRMERMGGLRGTPWCSFGSGAGVCCIPPPLDPVGGSGDSSSKPSS